MFVFPICITPKCTPAGFETAYSSCVVLLRIARAVLELTAKAEKCVVHFMNPEFRTCSIMAEHLKAIAKQHFKTRFYFFRGTVLAPAYVCHFHIVCCQPAATNPVFRVHCLCSADKGHWVAAKLKVRTLPAVLSFIGGICKDRILGFEELGNTDAFPTAVLEARLAKSGVISLGTENAAAAASTRIFGGFAKKAAEDSDDDD